jgi:exosortase A-associated hydrolase 1
MNESFTERAITFDCKGDTLIGIVAKPEQTIGRRGVLIVVGGPQYRAGSHRQFLLLSRHLAARGIPTMRFDYRGMGDSSGDLRDFEAVSPDIGAAVDCFLASVPEVKEVVLWGLCDGASASIFYAPEDSRITGLVIVNPWARTESGKAVTLVRHYYLRRILSADFWCDVVKGRVKFWVSVSNFLANWGHMLRRRKRDTPYSQASGDVRGLSLPDRLAESLERSELPILLIVSGEDLTAKEFLSLADCDERWGRLMARKSVQRFGLSDANHTFSRTIWRDAVAENTHHWVLSTSNRCGASDRLC